MSSLAVELQLSVTKSKFLLRQDVFIRGIAMQAGVNPIDVLVVTVTETNAPGTRADASRRRRRAELRVVTQIRTTDPRRVQGTLTLSAVNTALERAGLPPAEWMDVKTMPAGKMASASASAPPGTENIADQLEGNRRLVVLALLAAGGVLALLNP